MVSRKRIHKEVDSKPSTGKVENLIGRKFGRLTVVARAENDRHKKTRWRCLCDCGKESVHGRQELCKKDAQSCGCLRQELTSVRAARTGLEGLVVGLLTVQRRVGRQWECSCRCGNTKYLATKDLNGLRYNSCGCMAGRWAEDQQALWLKRRFSAYKSNAKKDSREFNLSLTEFDSITKQVCHYCGQQDTFTRGDTRGYRKQREPVISAPFYRVGVDRIDSSQGYNINNVVPCCRMCNKMKMEWDIHVWTEQVRRIYDHMELGRSDSRGTGGGL
jgi:hypothetical protein